MIARVQLPMRLLFLTPRLPYPPNRGGEILIFNFIKYLSARHEIALVSFYDAPEDLEHCRVLEQYCTRIEAVRRPSRLAARVAGRFLAGYSYSVARHLSDEFRQAIGKVRASWQPDLVQIEIFFMGTYLPELRGLRAVLHMHDVTWVMWERMAALAPVYGRPLVAIEAARIRRDELAVCRAVDTCINVSSVDEAHLKEAAGDSVRTRVVGPGVDTEALVPADPRPATAGLIFVGSMHYLPNVDAVEFFVREVLPLVAADVPDVTFTIVGARPSAAVQRLAADPRVTVTGSVPDVRPYYAQAAAVVVPLRIAGGVRLKILEALALGAPVVSTTIGAEGLELVEGREILLADGPRRFADAAIRLLKDPALRDSLGRHGRIAAEQRFSWESVGRTLESVYDDVLARPAGVDGSTAARRR